VLSKTSVNDLSVLSNLFLLALYYRDAYFFSHIFSNEIKKKKYHFRTIAKLSEVINSVLLHLTNITCLVVFVSGRLNNKDKSQTKVLSFGTKSVLSSFNIDVNYGYSNVVTPIGVFGIRCWMY
jgi:ribosomal protein S3